MHGGQVYAHSAGPGTGSEFLVELPIMDESVARIEDGDRLDPFPSRRVLVVDDNRDAAETLGELLSNLGATVAVAHSGQAALDQLPHFRPDTVLLDIGMPDMDGYEVARRIRQRSDVPGVLLIALTGWGQEQDHDQSRTAGFDHHLVKPPDIVKLRSLMTDGWDDVPGASMPVTTRTSPVRSTRHVPE
jgi:CheY-like chemotaxis protein